MRQAPTAPPELLTALFTLVVAMGQPAIGVGGLLCHAGLLCAREMLSFRGEHVVVCGQQVILLLGITKRGIERKVVLLHPTVVSWAKPFLSLTQLQPRQRAFPIAYPTFSVLGPKAF